MGKRIGLLIVALLLVLAGAALLTFGLYEAYQMQRLYSSGRVTEATVIETRIMTSTRRGRTYEVRYFFEVDGQRYALTDGTGRNNLWTSVTEEAYNSAQQKGTVSVRYLPENPKVNRPEETGSSPIGDNLAGAGLGLFFLLLGLGIGYVNIKKLRS